MEPGAWNLEFGAWDLGLGTYLEDITESSFE